MKILLACAFSFFFLNYILLYCIYEVPDNYVDQDNLFRVGYLVNRITCFILIIASSGQDYILFY